MKVWYNKNANAKGMYGVCMFDYGIELVDSYEFTNSILILYYSVKKSLPW